MSKRYQVVIVGGGPVGMALAINLGLRGITSAVIEPRRDLSPVPKGQNLTQRTLEHFDSWGIEKELRAARLMPKGYPIGELTAYGNLMSKYWHAPAGRELVRAFYSQDNERLPQYRSEEVLRRKVEDVPEATVLYGWTAGKLQQDERGVRIEISGEGGKTDVIEGDYLVGCDGASSRVRQGLGIKLQGRGTLGRALGIHFRAPDLRRKLGASPAVMYWIMAPGCGGTIYMIDGSDEWVYNRYFGPTDAVEFIDAARLLRTAIGDDTRCEILSVQDWSPRQLVAPSYGTSRVFLAGDACHLFVPTGGFGMNTGIADAADPGPHQALDGVAYRLAHPANLPVPALMDGDPEQSL